MAVPKKKTTKSKRNKRRMHIYTKAPSLVTCPQCKEKKLMHVICRQCGYYKGKEVIDVLKEKDKTKEKRKEKEQAGEKEKKSLTMEDLSKQK